MTKTSIWPNGLGATITSGRLMIEVWYHGGATRCERDKTPCGFSGTHFARVASGTLEQMGAAAVDLWRTQPAAWTACEA
jgi:hypothetical protein